MSDLDSNPNLLSNLNKHPADRFIRFLHVRDPSATDAVMMKALDDWGFLQPSPSYWGFLRQTMSHRPAGFDPFNRIHQPSMKYLRNMEIYELFYPTDAVNQAWEILGDPQQRFLVEQALMARLDTKVAAKALNKKHNLYLTSEGLQAYNHFFWNVKLLTFDEWGRFLYRRSSLYDRHMALLQAEPRLAFFHLRLEQSLESKKMIQRVMEIAFHAVEEVNLRPGVNMDKVKAISLLGKVVVDGHNALSTSELVLKDVLQQFEQFRMVHPFGAPSDIKALAPGGNYSGSGVDEKKEEEKVH